MRASRLWSVLLLVFILNSVAFAGQLRDPFAFGSREAGLGSGPPLIGILRDESGPSLAIVGEDAVAVGDSIGGWQVTAIEHDTIVVERDGMRESVTIGHNLPGD